MYTEGGSMRSINLRMGGRSCDDPPCAFRTQFTPSCQFRLSAARACQHPCTRALPASHMHALRACSGTGRRARRAFPRVHAHITGLGTHALRARSFTAATRHVLNKILYVMETRACMCNESVHFYRYDQILWLDIVVQWL